MTRLAPKDTIIKKLFALSGNRCAMPDCNQKMVKGGIVIGEICHIEAASKGGERYNEKQNDEERRSFDNLILLCPTHHKLSNDEKKFSVETLKEIKRMHETKNLSKPFEIKETEFPNIVKQILQTLEKINGGIIKTGTKIDELKKGQIEISKKISEINLNKSDKKENRALDTFVKLLGVSPVSERDTVIFKESNISHKKLCNAFSYWFDQCKTLFGEPVILTQIQSLRDAGVDLVLELLTSKQKFGFQIKSYGDVKEKDFSTKVMAQITQSKRHDLKKLVLAVAGNLNDPSQLEKIQGLFSEISQQKDDYVIIISPEKIIPIINTFSQREHPLKSVMLEISDGLKLAKSLSDSLSNESRKAKVDISFEYTIPPMKDGKKASFVLKVKDSDIDIFDRLEKINITGETIEFPKEALSEFKIEGDDWLKNPWKFQKLIVQPTEEFDNITISILDENNSVISSLKKMKFGKRAVGDETHVTLRDKNQESLKIIFRISRQMINFSCGVEFSNVDLEQIANAIEFRNALEKGNRIQIQIPEKNVDDKLDIPSEMIENNLDQNLVNLTDSLLIIEQKSGIKFQIPAEITNKEVREIIRLGNQLKDEIVTIRGGTITLGKEDAKRFIKIFEAKNTETFYINQQVKILEKIISLKIECDLQELELTKSVEEWLEIIKNTKTFPILIDIKPKNNESHARISINTSSDQN